MGERGDIEEFAAEVESLPLGELVDMLMMRRIELSQNDLSDRQRECTLREVRALKTEIDGREVGRRTPKKRGKRGVRSLGGIHGG